MHVTSVTETSGLAGNNNIVANELNRRGGVAACSRAVEREQPAE